jgi:hypothetical protein
MRTLRVAALSLALAGLTALPAAAVTVGTQDTFEDGTTSGWRIGPASALLQPVNVPDGGPAGAGDAYLTFTSTGVDGPGGRLVGIAGDQWFGDYIAAGVTAIAMDVINLGSTDVDLRLYFAGSSGTGTSVDGITVASGSGWRRVAFSTLPGAITVAPGVPALDVLSNVSELRLFHSAGTSFPGPNIAAQIGIDNVTAVPEPATWGMLGLGLAVIAGGVSLRRRHTG